MYSSIDTLIKNNKNAFYVFDILQLKTRLQYLRQCMPKNISLCYAVKANTFIVKEIINDVDRFEVCSPGEAAICRELHVSHIRKIRKMAHTTEFHCRICRTKLNMEQKYKQLVYEK